VFYDATRKLVLRGADGVVFVADSQNTMRDSNLDSLENLKTNLRLNRIDPDKVALVFQYNKRDLPTAESVEAMNSYLNPRNAPTVEASAINGTGVTATLRAAVSRILDNLKNNVDVTLHDEPPLAAPDMSQKAGVTTGSAGTPKLSMKTDAPPPPERAAPPTFTTPAQPLMQQAPFTAAVAAEPTPSPFEPELEDDPFAHVAVAEPEAAHDFEDPFAAPAVHDGAAERAELQALHASAAAVVAALEAALEQAREHERDIAARLAK
jgi:hypothetical protein